MEKSIREVSEATGISRFTLQQVAKKGTIPARQTHGEIWLIDTESQKFKEWLEAHWHQPRVKGQTKMRVHQISVHKENMSILTDLASKGFEYDYEAKSNIGGIYTYLNDQENIPVDKRVSAYQIREEGKVAHSSWPEQE